MNEHEALAGYRERVTALLYAWATVGHPPAQVSVEWRRLQSWHLLVAGEVPDRQPTGSAPHNTAHGSWNQTTQ